jgi:hypothetical protein
MCIQSAKRRLTKSTSGNRMQSNRRVGWVEKDAREREVAASFKYLLRGDVPDAIVGCLRLMGQLHDVPVLYR